MTCGPVCTGICRTSRWLFSQARARVRCRRACPATSPACKTLLTNSATDLAKHLSVVAATLVAMLLLDWRLACASLAVMPLLIWINGRVAQLRERVTYQQ